MNLKVATTIVTGAVGYIAYGLIAYFVDRSQLGGFLALNISMATGAIGLALRDMQYPNEVAAGQPAPPALPVSALALAPQPAPPTSGEPAAPVAPAAAPPQS